VNLTELADAVARIGIPQQLVALGGSAEYAWCVERAEDGAWEVYWLERGNKNNLVRLPSEDTACLYLLGRLTYSQLLAGAVRGPA
jgi:hypothetical protein